MEPEQRLKALVIRVVRHDLELRDRAEPFGLFAYVGERIVSYVAEASTFFRHPRRRLYLRKRGALGDLGAGD